MDRSEATGVGVSLVGHGAVLAVLVLGLASVGRAPPPSDAIEVSFVDEVGLVSAAPQPTQEPPAQGMAPETGPVDDAPAAPTPEPAQPEPRPTPAAAQPAPRQAAPSPAREAPAPPRARQPAQEKQGTSGSGRRTQRSRLGDDILKGIGDDPTPSTSSRPTARMTGEARASINAAIRRALVPCERQPLPSPEAGAIRVDVSVTLSRNGSLVGAQVRRVHNDDPGLRAYEERMRDLALAVVRQCTPIRGLPPELYDVPRGWRQFTYQFDPRQTR
ncbi:hypothetical protein [Sphingosinicella sp. CPCC 101087]|uniref:hypothetical protein n=1 Tax=Sphingosinicella sp. CPCC 101087 TaxID=2497754 RepID=UPI00101DFFA7|nr:hypothetical protein [Sphingosinicella sp. CPCC 101087]